MSGRWKLRRRLPTGTDVAAKLRAIGAPALAPRPLLLIEQSESMEGLVINLAIVFALVLSLIVATAIMFPQLRMLQSDLLGLLCSSASFRRFVVQTLEDQDFNFTRRVDLSRPLFDMKQWLLVDADLHPDVSGLAYAGYFGGRDVAKCNAVPEMAATYALVTPQFPLDVMLAWLAWHRDEVRVSDTANWYAAAAVGASCSGLVICIALYLSLMTSPVRRMERALQVWLRLGFPASIFMVLAMVLALFFAYEAVCWFLIANSTDWQRQRKIFLISAGLYIALPAFVVSIAVGTLSACLAHRALRKDTAPRIGDDDAAHGSGQVRSLQLQEGQDIAEEMVEEGGEAASSLRLTPLSPGLVSRSLSQHQSTQTTRVWM